MKLPSFSNLVQQSTKTYLRFPFTLIDAAIGTIAAIVMVENEGSHESRLVENILLTTLLGVSFLTTIVLVAEKRKWNFSLNFLAQVIGVAALVGYCFTLPLSTQSESSLHYIRFAMLLVGVHLLIAAAPFFVKNEVNGFWQYNKTLFLRILTAALYSGVLYAGLAIALLALEHLFGVEIKPKRYAELWVIIAGIFNTWFFLSGVPEKLDDLNAETLYPKGLKIFTQFILLPLVGIYLLILYAYMGKIVFTWQWPVGWVSSLILGFSITGILSLLLIYPVKDAVENVWIRTVSKWYYVILVPLVAMLLLAIWRRVSDYGITESRYVVVVLGLWLTGTTLYFIVSKMKNIKVIPSSLCLVAFLSTFGPWGAFGISEGSQINRLEQLLTKNQILVNGKIAKSEREVPFEDSKEISSIVGYLNEVHGTSGIQPWFDISLDTVGGESNGRRTNYYDRYRKPRLIVELMGVNYTTGGMTGTGDSYEFLTQQPSTIDVEGYTQLIRLNTFSAVDSIAATLPNNVDCVIHSDLTHLRLIIKTSGTLTDSVTIDLQPMIDRLVKEFGKERYNVKIPQEKMRADAEGSAMKAAIYVHHFQKRGYDNSKYGFTFDADILLAIKK